MQENEQQFKQWLAEHLPQVYFLYNETIRPEGVHFFGGTMWTDCNSGDAAAMRYAAQGMSDFRYIRNDGPFTPEASITLHQQFCSALVQWFEQQLSGLHVVITHHAPGPNPQSKRLGSTLQAALVASDMMQIIEQYTPDLWLYRHSHECDFQQMGKTRILANLLGYPGRFGDYECSENFDDYGCLVAL